MKNFNFFFCKISIAVMMLCGATTIMAQQQESGADGEKIFDISIGYDPLIEQSFSFKIEYENTAGSYIFNPYLSLNLGETSGCVGLTTEQDTTFGGGERVVCITDDFSHVDATLGLSFYWKESSFSSFGWYLQSGLKYRISSRPGYQVGALVLNYGMRYFPTEKIYLGALISSYFALERIDNEFSEGIQLMSNFYLRPIELRIGYQF